MRRSPFFVVAAAIAVTLAGGLAVTSPPDVAEAAPVTNWSDEFNGAAGQSVNSAAWNFNVGGGGWGNAELQTYTNSTANVATDGQGNLVINARKNGNSWTSGRIHTAGKISVRYGHVEARVKVPNGSGLWPAFWMLGGGNWPTDGEIDVMENVGRDPNVVFGTLHGPGYSGGSAVGGTRNIGQPVGNAFHVFSIDWSPNLVVWKLDGSEYFRATPASLRGNRWVFDHEFFLILNVAIGGNFGGGNPASLPAENKMLVDYVRVSGSDSGPVGTGIRGAGSGRCIDIPGANPVDGALLQIYDCNNSAAQQWSTNANGTVTAMGKCMDAAAAGTADGTAVQLATCNGTGAQRFTLNAAGDLVNATSGKCVDVVGVATANGSRLHLWTCTGASNQKWARS